MRLVVFTDSNTMVTARLIRATLRVARKGRDHGVVGIVTTRPKAFPTGSLTIARALMMRAVLAASNAEVPTRLLLDPALDLRRIGHRYGIPVLVPPTGDPNDIGFVRETIAGLRPGVALSYFCRHRFRLRLRSAFARAVNFHAGALPDYRGVMVTSFSILAGESRSGLAFHHMTARLDRGPVLVQDSDRGWRHSRRREPCQEPAQGRPSRIESLHILPYRTQLREDSSEEFETAACFA